MIYVMSDIHGEYGKYMQMLKEIDFSDSDTLYVLGDVIDRGPEPVKILQDMSMRTNVYPLVGNHEAMAIDVLDKLVVDITDENYDTQLDAGDLKKLLLWQSNGGDITLAQFQCLSAGERRDLLDYLKEFNAIETVQVRNKTFILVHAGFSDKIDTDKPFDEYTALDVAFVRPDYRKRVFPDSDDTYVIMGHTPTVAICGMHKIVYSNYNICIDCAATFDGKLACLRLDDMKEFYV